MSVDIENLVEWFEIQGCSCFRTSDRIHIKRISFLPGYEIYYSLEGHYLVILIPPYTRTCYLKVIRYLGSFGRVKQIEKLSRGSCVDLYIEPDKIQDLLFGILDLDITPHIKEFQTKIIFVKGVEDRDDRYLSIYGSLVYGIFSTRFLPKRGLSLARQNMILKHINNIPGVVFVKDYYD